MIHVNITNVNIMLKTFITLRAKCKQNTQVSLAQRSPTED